uniref:enoyl-CoA hydratase domain-containing protein 3, mitochondrial-like n=1 Tax=Styela clava TaxID=7725 RepID=UPI001939B2EF|nr:enoyl-CoA hydratase domain-containing protein 3, mitochondrial-like [Styela clava]
MQCLKFQRLILKFGAVSCRSFASSTAEPLTIVKEEDGIRRITLNNPRKRNALSLNMLNTLKENISKDVDSEKLRVIVLSANGPVFSAGHDLKELMSFNDRSKHTEVFSLCSEVMELIQNVPVPVLCQVEGLATAAGCQLVATCDIAIASENATFCTPGVNVGLFCSTPAVALGRSVPKKLALEMLFTGEVISAQRALMHGLVSRVVPKDDLNKETDEMLEKICNNSRSVMALGKSTFYRQITKDTHSAYKDTSCVMVDNLGLKDCKEGLAAFNEKRKPTWGHTFE